MRSRIVKHRSDYDLKYVSKIFTHLAAKFTKTSRVPFELDPR